MSYKEVSQSTKDQIVEQVRTEIAKYQQGELDRFTTSVDLAAAFGIAPLTVKRQLSALSVQDRRLRAQAILSAIGSRPRSDGSLAKAQCTGEKRTRLANNPNAKQQLTELVRSEITQYRQGKLDKLRTNKELASLLGVSPQTVATYLQALDEQDASYRIQAIRRATSITGLVSMEDI